MINRSYYAMFYASLALLLTKGLGAWKHAGVLAMLDREFVHPGLLPQEFSRLLRAGFNARQRSDYMELAPATEDGAKATLADAGQVLAMAEAFAAAWRSAPDLGSL